MLLCMFLDLNILFIESLDEGIAKTKYYCIYVEYYLYILCVLRSNLLISCMLVTKLL